MCCPRAQLNEHLTFPPLPNNTNGLYPSWNGLGGVMNPLWYNSQVRCGNACTAVATKEGRSAHSRGTCSCSQGYSFHSYGKTGHQLQFSVNSNLGIAINTPPAGQQQLHDDTASTLDALAGTNNVGFIPVLTTEHQARLGSERARRDAPPPAVRMCTRCFARCAFAPSLWARHGGAVLPQPTR